MRITLRVFGVDVFGVEVTRHPPYEAEVADVVGVDSCVTSATERAIRFVPAGVEFVKPQPDWEN